MLLLLVRVAIVPLLLFFESLPFAGANDCPAVPEIIIKDHYPNVTPQGNKSTVYFPEPVFIVLKCSSQNPIYWNYAHDHSLNQWRFIRPKRTTADPLDRNEDCFEATLFLYTRINATGEYTCEDYNGTSKASSIYIYIDDKNVSPVISNWQPRLKIENPEVIDDWIQIPCKTTNPTAQVQLFKDDNGRGDPIQLKEGSLRWDSQKGFFVNIRSLKNTYAGTYMCKSFDNNHNGSRNVEIVITDTSSKPEVKVTSAQRSREVVCSVPLGQDLKELVFKKCNNLIECFNVEQRIAYKDAGDAWSLIPDCACPSQHECRCHTIPDLAEEKIATGVVQCTAAASPYSVSVSTSVYQFYGMSGQFYALTKDEALTIRNIELVEVVQISRMLPATGTFYVGQEILFVCKAVSFLVSEGLEWAFKLKNGTIQSKREVLFEVPTEKQDKKRKGFTITSELKIVMWTTEIESVMCLAPLWNTYDYLNSTKEISVQKSRRPKILSQPTSNGRSGNDEDINQIYANSRNVSFNCTASGDPKPRISWTKSGSTKPLPSGAKQIDIPLGNGLQSGPLDETLATSSLTFSIVTEDHGGEYVCTASNYAGSRTSTLEIDVLEAEDKPISLGVILGPVVAILVLLIAIIFLYWRVVAQKRLIQQILSETELDEFFNGNPEARKSIKKRGMLTEYAQFLPYKKEYEILAENIQIEEGTVLGNGQYGIVYKAKLTTTDGEDKKDEKAVAVKTVKPGAEKDYLKALLSEIKIMIAIGVHTNVVEFIGALTENIRDGKLMIVVEFCGRGSLEKYLRDNRNSFVNQIRGNTINIKITNGGELNTETTNTEGEQSKSEDTMEFNTTKLVKWACEIAAGMEYLAEKKVIHADLACRNVLITNDGSMKITDFGLSRQLYENKDYVKKSQDPLPWRWMAIESIRDMNFSVQSDIWSFGVTTWELFTLGATPFPGYTWNEEFLQKVEGGLRPGLPAYATTSIYGNMMECWSLDPAHRPSFTNIRTFYRQILTIPQELTENTVSKTKTSAHGQARIRP